ncbi:MAG: hypothetical protein WAU75_14265 [Solirubrobacteraceae bacterium]
MRSPGFGDGEGAADRRIVANAIARLPGVVEVKAIVSAAQPGDSVVGGWSLAPAAEGIEGIVRTVLVG